MPMTVTASTLWTVCGMAIGVAIAGCAKRNPPPPAGPAATSPAGDTKGAVKIAFVLLSEPRLPKGDGIVRAFASFAKGADQIRVEEEAGPSEKDGADAVKLQMTVGGPAFVMLMPSPVPKGEAEWHAKYSVSSFGTGWTLPPHGAHLIVTMTGADALPVRERLSRLTWLLAAVAEASGAVGIYWGDAGATHSPKFFSTMAKETAMVARLTLWTGVSVAREADGRYSVLSRGMKQLALPNLLLVAPGKAPQEAFAVFFDLLSYLVERGKALPEGDTVGRTDKERLPVHYVPSPADPTETVWRVELM